MFILSSSRARILVAALVMLIAATPVVVAAAPCEGAGPAASTQTVEDAAVRAELDAISARVGSRMEQLRALQAERARAAASSAAMPTSRAAAAAGTQTSEDAAIRVELDATSERIDVRRDDIRTSRSRREAEAAPRAAASDNTAPAPTGNAP
jgi:hypothetical protein